MVCYWFILSDYLTGWSESEVPLHIRVERFRVTLPKCSFPGADIVDRDDRAANPTGSHGGLVTELDRFGPIFQFPTSGL